MKDLGNSLPNIGSKETESEYGTVSKLTTELDRVPEFVLKQYEKNVLFHRDIADQVYKVSQKTEGKLSKILRHEDHITRQEYLSEFDHYKAKFTLRRNLFPEGIVGVKEKPRFGVEAVESPSWNRGSKKQGYNFTEGRKSRSKKAAHLEDDDD